MFGLLGGVMAAGAAVMAYEKYLRPWHLRWGATDEETAEPLPGDEVRPDAGVQITHAVTIDAPPDEVWKWLVQIGQGRGGFFSYDWLENSIGLDIHTSEEIVPELQDLKVGDFVRGAHPGWLGGRFDDKAGWHVVRLDPAGALVLQDSIEAGTWSFILRPVNEHGTRFIIRARGPKPETVGMKAFHRGIMEPAHFIMERKMMLRLKELAERSYRERRAPVEIPAIVAA